MSKSHYVVILAEPDQATRAIYQETLCTAFEVIPSSDEETIFHALQTRQIGALILEPMLFVANRRQRLIEVSCLCADLGIPIVICSTLDERRQGAELGISIYLIKPVLPTTLLDTLQHMLGIHEYVQEPAVRTTASVEQRTQEQMLALEASRLAAAQATAIVEERQRLARDLHDSVTQALYGITLHAQVVRRLLAANDPAGAADSLDVLQNTAQEALDEMRMLIFELRPPILEQIGLVAALRARLNSVEGRANLETRFVADELLDLPSSIEQALYRIAQEALNNALKHAHARWILVRLQQLHSCIGLEISDDGVGFELPVVDGSGGLGLRGIAERVAQLNGTFSLESSTGMGTRLCVEIPL